MSGGGEGAERFRRLYDRHVAAVVAYVVRRVGSAGGADAGDAGDVVADVFLVAWRRLDDVPDGDAARPWLLGVARRVLANRRRGDARRARLGERLQAHLDRALPADDGMSDTVNAALDRLGEEDREVLRLTAWDGLTPSEVAVVLGIPAATARTRIHRARGRLRRELAVASPESPAIAGGGEDR